jgi:cellulose synthase/poly-beta-1,6-N-acetylglucosamine synthase-like glycosyltransferase
MMGLWLLGAAAAFAAYTYVGYPALLLMAGRRRLLLRTAAPSGDWPVITILLPARNEEAVIAATLENLLRADYPADRRHILVLSDASTDRTDAIVAGFSGRGVRLLRMPSRDGKTAAENAAIAQLRGEIVVNTDASVQVEPNALKRLIRCFADPTVAVASSHNVSVPRRTQHANAAEAWYVGYDMWVRDLESRVSGIVGAAGCLYAARLPVQRQILPRDLTRDFAAALRARELGWRAVSVRDAVCFVPRIPSLRREYWRKVRTITRGIRTLWYKRALLNPLRYGLFSWILVSHKVCRWGVPFLALIALAWMPWAWSLVGIAGVCAAVAWWWPEGNRLPRLIAVPGYFTLGNLAVLHAAWLALVGAGAPTWEPTRRPRPTMPATPAI